MKLWWNPLVTVVLLVGPAIAATKPHVVVFGKWTTIKWQAEDGSVVEELKIRALLVDGKPKEFTSGLAHDVTDRLFVVQRMFRANDSLPQESGPTRWRWEKGGWVAVDRISGRVQPILLPALDSYHSQVSWFRDYAAYCGVSDDGTRAFAVIAQLGKRRPLMRKVLSEHDVAGCGTPMWQREPVRVTFATKEDPKLTFTVNNRMVDLASNEESDGEE